MPPLAKDVGDAFRISVAFGKVLQEIARGREDNGRALSGDVARQKARNVLLENGYDYTKKGTGQ